MTNRKIVNERKADNRQNRRKFVEALIEEVTHGDALIDAWNEMLGEIAEVLMEDMHFDFDFSRNGTPLICASLNHGTVLAKLKFSELVDDLVKENEHGWMWPELKELEGMRRELHSAIRKIDRAIVREAIKPKKDIQPESK